MKHVTCCQFFTLLWLACLPTNALAVELRTVDVPCLQIGKKQAVQFTGANLSIPNAPPARLWLSFAGTAETVPASFV